MILQMEKFDQWYSKLKSWIDMINDIPNGKIW